MAVLSNEDINNIIEKNKGIIIMNMCGDNLTAPGYDFRIGFIRDSDEGNEPTKIECVFDTEEQREYKKEEFFNDSRLREEYIRNKERYKFRYRYELLSGHRYLVISKEYIALLKNYMATLHSRGSYALKGVIVTSTIIDPNYRGFIYASLINCSKETVYIKENNGFVTMVIQTLVTKTNKTLRKTEGGMPMDAEQTLNGTFSNVCEEATMAAKTYRTDAWKKIEREFEDQYAIFQRSSSKKARFMDEFSKAKKFFIENIFITKGFWIGVCIFILLLFTCATGGIDEAIAVLQKIIKKFL